MRRIFAIIAVVLAWLPTVLAAQNSAAILADSVTIVGESTIIAEGNVEVIYGDTRLEARRVTYNRLTEELIIQGPIILTEGEESRVTADYAELDSQLRNGIVEGAEIALEQRLNIRAERISRTDGTYNDMYGAVATTCQVCNENETPFWEVRARSIRHDTTARRLYFRNAHIRVLGIPVFFTPRLSIPDPSVERASGFLLPSLKTTSELATGIKIPYFQTLGDHADVTITPYVSPVTRTLELRYRQAFRRGEIEFNAAGSDDDIRPGEFRGYLFGEGQFRLPRRYKLSFDFQTTSDPGYLLDYGYSNEDRLRNELSLTRTTREAYVGIGLLNFRTLRDSEIPTSDQLPYLLGEAIWERRYHPSFIGGETRLSFDAQGHSRESELDILGRDVLRLGGSAEWHRDWTLRTGMVAGLDTALDIDLYQIAQDSTYETQVARYTPALAAELRWPFAKVETSGAAQLLEPIVQLAWTESYGDPVPNEDSALVEFDEGNLISLSRFAGKDAEEVGLRGAFGTTWSRDDPTGWSIGVTVGRIFRAEENTAFSESSGLSGLSSDWLLAGRVTLGDRFALSQRTLADDMGGIGKSETRIDWSTSQLNLGLGYTWVEADLAEDRLEHISEARGNGRYRFKRHWTARVNARYDVNAERMAQAGAGLEYQNECIKMDFSVSRRFTSSTSVSPTTNVEFTLSLGGYGEESERYRRICSEFR
ncbi:MAG: LPS-assembly protein LptD [Rhodobacteraceae bacterium]|nr:LPS-assembly protein LptD [Paracoccaceae bacterium]